MIRSVMEMVQADLGFRTEGVSRGRLVLPARNYPDAAAFRRFYERFADRAAAVANSPIAFTSWPPFVETPKQIVQRDTPGGPTVPAGVLMVSPGFFSMVGIEVWRGRALTETDSQLVEPVVVISRTLASRLFPDGSAIGHRVQTLSQTTGSSPGPWRTVVGVAPDVQQTYGVPAAGSPFRTAPGGYDLDAGDVNTDGRPDIAA